MNKHQFEGKWHELKGKVKERWGDLTDDDFTQTEGRMEELAGRIQQRYGGTKQDIMRELEKF